MKRLLICLVVAVLIASGLTSCEEAARYVINEVTENVTDTVIRDISREGRPWDLVDSLLGVVGGLESEVDSLTAELANCIKL